MRLDKFLVSTGKLSRSEAGRAARGGQITVNGVVEKRADRQIDPDLDVVVLNGETIQEEQLVVIPVGVGSLVTLATDGYPVLSESFEQSEAVLRECLEKDPFCYRENLQTKGMQIGNGSFDDRCFLQFTTK